MSLKKTDLAWCAGIVDGEGTIRISCAPPRINKRTVNPSYQLYVSAQMTHKNSIKKLSVILGGKVTFNKSYDIRHRPTYRWGVVDHAAVATLKLLYPYLITKKRQAKLGLEFRDKGEWGEKRILSKRVVKLRNRFYLKMRHLNLRGTQNDQKNKPPVPTEVL